MKHLLNDLTEQEKKSIREQYTGKMNVVTENFLKLINTKSGDVKPLVNEDFFDIFKSWNITNQIEYNGYIIPVYRRGNEKLLGHPRPENEDIPYMEKLIAYNFDKLPQLKKSIDAMVENPGATDFSHDYVQSQQDPMDQSGTPVPSIFPKKDKIIKNPKFKGYNIS